MVCLDRRRARQILDSHGVIEVLHNGSPVWIENLRGNNAEVTYIGTDNRAEIPVDKLVESSTMGG